MKRALSVVRFGALCVSAQWLTHPTPGIPRTPDGKANLAAPAPRMPDGKPDLSGIWTMAAGRYTGNITADLKPGEVQPWAEDLYKQRRENLGSDSPFTGCLPQGPAMNLNPVAMNKLVQTPGLIVFLAEDLTYRQIFLDGRELPKDPNPSFMGYSVGRWEGDTLVIDTIGFNGRTRIDTIGHPHSDQLHTIEKFKRTDLGHIDYVLTIDDPKAYTKPWDSVRRWTLHPEWEIMEYSCEENNKSLWEGRIKVPNP